MSVTTKLINPRLVEVTKNNKTYTVYFGDCFPTVYSHGSKWRTDLNRFGNTYRQILAAALFQVAE